jgi:hypothetical protein
LVPTILNKIRHRFGGRQGAAETVRKLPVNDMVLPIKYVRTKIEDDEHFNIMEHVVRRRRYKFDLLDEEVDQEGNLLMDRQRSSNLSPSTTTTNERTGEDECVKNRRTTENRQNQLLTN